MKKILLIPTLAVAFFSCTKQVDSNSQPVEHVTKGITSVTEKMFYGDQNDSVRLSVSADPSVICKSYGNNEPPQSCNIYVNFTCKLSRPVNSFVRVEIERNNVREVTEPPSGTDDVAGAGSRVVLVIAPNTTSKEFTSTFNNLNNISVPDDAFRIVSVTTFMPVN